MMNLLFVGIPNMLFIPFAVTAVCGAVFAFLYYWKKHDRFYWIITLSIVFMLGWRLMCHSVMVVPRYASILLYPAAIFSAYLCFFLRDILKFALSHFPSLNTPLMGKIYRFLPFFLVVVLAVVCTVKTLRFNPHNECVIRLCQALTGETAGKKCFVFSNIEERRLPYYFRNNDILFWDPNTKFSAQILKEKLADYGMHHEDLYFIFYIRKGETEPDAGSLKLDPKSGKWECVYEEYTSRREDRKIVLYRFSPSRN